MLEKNIKFYRTTDLSEEAIPYPEPASKFVPEWYRKSSSHINENQGPKVSIHGNVDGNLTVKRCVPFFDAMTSGYMLTLPADIVFLKPENNEHRVAWSVSYDVVGTHSIDQAQRMPIPNGYSRVIFKWLSNFRIETPAGYSCMFNHPNFMYDSPFMTISGIVDTDKHPIPVNFPFFIKDGFEGIIEKGTPICQITPFKRESWKMKKEGEEKDYISKFNNFYSTIEKSYRNRFWSKKSYR